MLLNRLLQLPSPVGNLALFYQFSTSLSQYQIDLKDIQELVSIATDDKLYYGSDREFFAMYYALYAWGALRQVEECPEILAHLNRMNRDDEWISNYINVFEMLGEKVIPYLIEACRYIKFDLLFILTESLAKLSIQYPTYREQILNSFDEVLFRVKSYLDNSEFTAMVESALLTAWLEMKAFERIEIIRKIEKSHKLGQHISCQIDALMKSNSSESV